MRSQLSVLCILVLLSGCATNLSQYGPIERSLQNRDYKKTVDLIQDAKSVNFEKKDRVLYSLELGLAQHYADLYKESNHRLTLADGYIDELYTKSISNMGYSFLTNSTELPYRGEPYENIYLNAFKSLNYAHLQKPQAVFVEIRKIQNKLNVMERRFKQMAQEYEESALSSLNDTSVLKRKNASFQAGESRFYSSALGHYLSYLMYLNQGELDDARIDLNNLREAFKNQPGIYNFELPDLPRDPSVDSDKARVNVFALLGQGPIKIQEGVRVRYKDHYVKWVYPELIKRGTKITRVVVSRQNEQLATLDKLEDVNRVSKAVFEVKEPIIKAYNFVRAVSKSIVTNELVKNTDNPILATLAKVTSQEFTENADLRTTRLLPGEIHVGHVTVPAQQPITLTFHYYSNGQRIAEETVTRTFHNDALNFVEIENFK
jgi:hypothetical protein